MGSEESTPSHERQNVSGDDIEKLLEDQRRHIEETYNNIHREALKTELKNQELAQTAAREVARNELEKLMREKNNGASTSESHHSSSTRRPWTGKNTMESPRKFNDCYFYYYSTCTKGDNCVFRHEPAALGCETMCTAWQQGKCLDKRCKLRHMELRKNRKQIPCYWENQPGGCRKKHCSFMHKNPEARTDGIAPSQPAPPTPVAPAGGVAGGVGVGESVSEAVAVPQVPQPVPPTAPPVPLMWQQQRQVVTVDSAILGVLPAGGGELLGARRVMPTHAHAHAHAHPHAHAHAHDAPNPYAPHPVDPLVVNFEEGMRLY